MKNIINKFITCENPEVIAPPPLIFIVSLIMGFTLDYFFPLSPLKNLLSFPFHVAVALFIGIIAITIGATAAITFIKAGTNIPTILPAVKLVTQGIYRYTRNPMYIALFLLLVTFVIGLASTWLLILLAPYSIIMHYGVIKREESYLAKKFGETYEKYKGSTPRYLMLPTA